MHTPAYRRLYVHVLCTYELCSSAKLPSPFGGALAVRIRIRCPTTVPFLHRCVCVCMLRGIVSLREGRRLLVPSRV